MHIKKLVCLALLLALIPIGASANIYNNSGTNQADSISITFFALDSAGNAGVNLVANDSLYFVTFYPDGTIAFRDTVAFNNALIDTVKFSGDIYYNWHMAVADIDGSGVDGVYSYILAVHDNTSAALVTPHRGTFQVYQTSDYNVWADRLTDSLQGVIDSIQSQDDWVAQQDSLLAALDSIYAILDSIQSQSTWVGHQSTLDTLLDTLPANFTDLAILGTGEVGIDLDNTQGTIDAADNFGDAYIDFATVVGVTNLTTKIKFRAIEINLAGQVQTTFTHLDITKMKQVID